MDFRHLLKEDPSDTTLRALSIEEKYHSDELASLEGDGATLVDADGNAVCTEREFTNRLRESVIEAKAKRRRELGLL